jgi:hypothetical protein
MVKAKTDAHAVAEHLRTAKEWRCTWMPASMKRR